MGSKKLEASDRPWIKGYEPHVAPEINITENSLIDVIENSFNEFRHNPAFTCMGKTINFDKLDQYSRELAAYFQNTLGLKKGDRVAIMMPNILQYPVALFAIIRSGLVCVNVNPLYTARELEHQLTDSGAETIIIAANFAHTLAEVQDKVPVKNVIITELADLLGFPKSLILNFLIKHVKKMVPSYQIENSIDFMTALGEGSSLDYDRPDVQSEEIAFLQYTGGTTGVAKGAMLTHLNVLSNLHQARSWITSRMTKGKEVIITPLPMYHIFSLVANCFVYSSVGAHNILIPNPRDLKAFIKVLKSTPFTAMTGVNTLFNGLLNQEEFRNLDFSGLRVALGGGMAIQESVAKKWKEVTGQPLIQAYGLTETSPAATMVPFNAKEFDGSIGFPIPATDLSCRDDDGKEVPQGEPGEIWIKGPQVMKGYYNRPEETAKCLTKDGWLKTGDIAVMNENGSFTIVDRKKDMIIVSGFNVYPNEIEEVVSAHEGVLECAAVGVEDEKTGEAIKVFVVKKSPTLTKDDLISHCRESLTGYKVPKQFAFKDDLPKTNVGKILRRALREQ